MRRLCGLLLSVLGSMAADRKLLMAVAFAACLISVQHLAAAVPFSRDWAATWDLGWINDRGQSIASDSSGNLYVAGINEPEYYLRKYSPAGQELWTRTVTTGYVSFGGFIDAWVVVDPSDHPILAGTMNVGDGPAPLDLFVARFDPAGTQLWLRTFDADGDNDVLVTVAIDGDGTIYAHGTANESGPRDVFTVKVDSDGTRLWAATYTDADDLGGDVAVHSDGSVYTLVSTTGYGTNDDIILIKYDASGTQLWLRRFNGGGESGWPPEISATTDDWPSRLELDVAGNAYLVGYSEPSPGGGHGLVTQKYLPDGTLEWTRRYDVGPPSSGDFGHKPAGLAVDGSGQVYVSGQILNDGTGIDVVTIKYAADGTPLWSSTYNGDRNGDDVPSDLVLTPDGSVFVLARSRVQLQTDFGQLYEGFRLLLLQYDTDGTPLSAEVDGASDDGAMLTRCGASIAIVGTSPFAAAATSHDVTVRKCSPVQRSRIRRHLRMP